MDWKKDQKLCSKPSIFERVDGDDGMESSSGILPEPLVLSGMDYSGGYSCEEVARHIRRHLHGLDTYWSGCSGAL